MGNQRDIIDVYAPPISVGAVMKLVDDGPLDGRMFKLTDWWPDIQWYTAKTCDRCWPQWTIYRGVSAFAAP
jgi:hypothetical protein